MNKKTQSGTDVNHVKQQNQKSRQGGSSQQYGTEFASETDVQQVQQQNQQSRK